MKRKYVRFIVFGLTIGLLAALTMVLAACSSATSTSPAATATTSTPTLSSITIAPATPAALSMDSTLQFTATGTYSDGSTQDISSSVTWSSDTNSVATINSIGLATGVSTGNANITATMSGVTSNSVVLTVAAPAPSTTAATSSSAATLSSISIMAVSPDNSANLAVGDIQQYTATGTYSDGSTADISSSVTWNSDDTGVATIDSNGFATGVAPGNANITATMSGVTSSSAALTVVTPPSTTSSGS